MDLFLSNQANGSIKFQYTEFVRNLLNTDFSTKLFRFLFQKIKARTLVS